MRRSWVVLLCGIAAAASLVLSACSRTPASLKALAAERAFADSLVAGSARANPELLAVRAHAARRKTEAFLRKHDDDVPAALLFVKLRIAEAALTPQPPPVDSSGTPLDHFEHSYRLKKGMADCLPVLDRAIKKAPKSAELYYWKALVLGLWEPIYAGNALDRERSQLPLAVTAASTAVELAPDSSTYRTALATYQMLSGNDAAAIATLRAGKKPGEDTTLRLLEEWQKIPLPPGAVLSGRESSGIADWLGASGLEDAHARVRAYWIPGSADSVRAYYARVWGDLFWLKQPPQKSNGETWSYSSSAVIVEGDRYRALHQTDIRNKAMANAEGISLQLREVRSPQPKTREAVPFAAGSVVCEMLLTNHRHMR